MDSHAAAADLDAVQNDVICFRANFRKLLLVEQREIFRFWSRERVMHRVPLVLFGVPLQQRKICDPKKIPVRARHGTSPSDWRTGLAFCSLPVQILNLCNTQPNPA